MEINEWLNNNQLSIDIFNKKYRYNNETLDEWFNRVSGGNSEIKRLIKEKKFLFGGRILANRGLDKSGRKITLSNCFLAGTKVLTKEGYKNIEEIREGEYVLTHDNTWQPVNAIMSRSYRGSIYKIKAKNLLSPIFCTPNHKFLTSNGTWKSIENFVIRSNGHTKIDRLMSSSEMLYYKWDDINIDILEGFTCEVKRRIVEEDNNVGLSEYVEDKGTYIWRKPRRFVNRYFTIDEEMLYLIGRWVGDGSITSRASKDNPSIWQIVFNATSERDACAICYDIIKKHFPLLNPTIRETDQNVLALRVENEIFATWFNNTFGKGCEGKYIPEWLGYPRNLLLGLLDSDGSVHSQGDFKLLLKNSRLINWARKALFTLGINTSEIKPETRQVADSFMIGVNQSRKLIPYLNKTYGDSRMDVNLALDTQAIKIDSIEILEDYNTVVYNLSVENNHSYMVNGVFAHNCYVIPAPEDNLESIFDTGSKLARTYSYGGGCGVDVSKLRPKGAKVNNAASSTTGTTSFMNFYSDVTGLIGQEGRRGALMLSIDCTHPDLEEFINLKCNLDTCTKANISVRVSDAFMKAVESDDDWILYFDTEHEHIEKIVRAKDIFMLLAKRNWEMAEPGVLFWDRIKNYNMLNTDPNFEYAGVNPCAEEPLPAGGSCLLGSLNLSEFVGDPFNDNCYIDYCALRDAVDIAVNGLNQVLIEGMYLHPLEIQRQSVHDWRQIGLGTFGLGDMFIKLGIKYGSKESINIINNIFGFIARTAVEASLELAKLKGCYPMCNKEALVNSSFIKNLDLPKGILDDIKKYGLYNSQLLTCAPTGSTATMLQVSTGVEPNFALSYNRRTVSLNNEETIYNVDADIVQQYKKVWGNCPNDELPDFFITSQEIPWKERIDVQSALQEWIDASISSTVNLPESTTIEEVFNLYMYAWESGLKGVTIWRDNCQREGILTTKKEEKENSKNLQDWIDFKNTGAIQLEADHSRGYVIPASNNWLGLKRTLTTGCGSLHVTAYFDPDNGELRECYLSKGSTGGCQNFMIGLSRMISLSARGGVGIEAILDQLKSCGVCPSYAVRSATKKDTSKGSCCPVAVGNALKEMYDEMQDIICECKGEELIENPLTGMKRPKGYVFPGEVLSVGGVNLESGETFNSTLEECPNCHEKTLIHQGGCVSCPNCSFSRCD